LALQSRHQAFLKIYPYPFTSTFGISNVLVIGYGSVLSKRPDDGSVEPKHVALNVFLTINWMRLTETICTLYIFSNTSG
jgi:hypothetical protein